jgi:hypothetical protein
MCVDTEECEGCRRHAAPVQQDMMTTDITIECHDGYVPEWAEAELNRLYGNIYSSLTYFRLFGGLEHAYTYVARRGEGARLSPSFCFVWSTTEWSSLTRVCCWTRKR